MKFVEQDIIEHIIMKKPTVVIQGCNSFSVQGAGIAKSLTTIWADIHQQDKEYELGTNDRLGNFSFSHINRNTTVYNLYTQYAPGPNFMVEAYVIGLTKILTSYQGKKDITFVMPRIGCGIGTINGEQIETWRLHVKPWTEKLFNTYRGTTDELTIVGLQDDNKKYLDN